MKLLATALQKSIESYKPGLLALSEEVCAFKPSPAKWSKKEIVGHLIDSAQNNMRRFIVAQYEENPFIVYMQDDWVRINDYQNGGWTNLVNLWYLLNVQVAHLLNTIPPETAQRTCRTGELYTIEWLAEDYIKHLKHHIHYVLNLEAVAYP